MMFVCFVLMVSACELRLCSLCGLLSLRFWVSFAVKKALS